MIANKTKDESMDSEWVDRRVVCFSSRGANFLWFEKSSKRQKRQAFDDERRAPERSTQDGKFYFTTVVRDLEFG